MRAVVWVGSFVIGGAAALWCSLAPAGDVATFLLALLLFGVAVEVVVIALAIHDKMRGEPPVTVNVYVAPGAAAYFGDAARYDVPALQEGEYVDAEYREVW
jgi:hypothetical protein